MPVTAMIGKDYVLLLRGAADRHRCRFLAYRNVKVNGHDTPFPQKQHALFETANKNHPLQYVSSSGECRHSWFPFNFFSFH
jgi:hypothetical protein